MDWYRVSFFQWKSHRSPKVLKEHSRPQQCNPHGLPPAEPSVVLHVDEAANVEHVPGVQRSVVDPKGNKQKEWNTSAGSLPLLTLIVRYWCYFPPIWSCTLIQRDFTFGCLLGRFTPKPKPVWQLKLPKCVLPAPIRSCNRKTDHARRSVWWLSDLQYELLDKIPKIWLGASKMLRFRPSPKNVAAQRKQEIRNLWSKSKVLKPEQAKRRPKSCRLRTIFIFWVKHLQKFCLRCLNR